MRTTARREKVGVKGVNQITEGVIWKQLLYFFFPILFGTVFQELYNTADAVIVGRFVGKAALAAVGGATGSLINIFVSMLMGISAGTTVVVAQAFGGNDAQGVHRAVHTAVALSVTAGLGITVVGIAAAPQMLVAMGTPDGVMGFAVLYLRVFLTGMIPAFLYNIGSGILRAVGDSRRPLYFLIVSSLSNIALDILFVVAFRLGVLGAALATVIATTLSAALIMASLRRSDASYRLEWRHIRLYGRTLREILKVGVPAGLQSSMYAISNLLIQSAVNSFGTDTMAAFTAFRKLDAFCWMVIGAYGVSITTFSGQNFGAHKYDRIRKSVRICLGLGFGTTILLSTVFYLAAPVLLRLFNSDPRVIEIGLEIVRYMVPYYFTFVCVEIFSGAARGCGSVLVPTLMTSGGVCVIRVLWVLFVLPLKHTLGVLMVSYPISWVLTSVLFIIYYLQGGWLHSRIKKLGYPPEMRVRR